MAILQTIFLLLSVLSKSNSQELCFPRSSDNVKLRKQYFRFTAALIRFRIAEMKVVTILLSSQ